MQTALQSRPVPHRFHNLPFFTPEEVAVWNWFCRVGPSHEEWSFWIADILGHLVEHPDGLRLRLVQSHALDASFGEKSVTFGAKGEISIGRDPENDVVLPGKAISKQHARLTIGDQHTYLEDLGGKLGTYLWDKRLRPGEPQPLSDGDQFSVFPYRFRVVLERSWKPEKDVALSKCQVHLLPLGNFIAKSPLGWKVLVLNTHPTSEATILSIDPLFVAELRRRILGPLGLHRTDPSVPSDDTVLGFVILAVLERLNRRLRLPLQFSLVRGDSRPVKDSVRGMLVSAALTVGGLNGQFRAFLPLDLLAKCMPEAPPGWEPRHPEGLCWAFPISSAFVDLSPDEIEQVGLGDILVTDSQLQILFPNDFTRGWCLSADQSNTSRLLIDKYFERAVQVEAVEEAKATGTKPDLAGLPIRVHVIVGQKELTVAEINSLNPGTIVELQTEKSDPVRLMVNGKILGEGELVDVDGKLAVKVLGWRSA